MHSIIVVPSETARTRRIRLAPGDVLDFGTLGDDDHGPPGGARLSLPRSEHARPAGRITASGTHWHLTNLSGEHALIVQNPEDAGEHLTVAAGRVAAPVPFEFSRVLLPSGGAEPLGFEVWAPLHEYLDACGRGGAGAGAGAGAGDAPAGGWREDAVAYPLDRSKQYFLVLVALCAARLRGASCAPPPTTGEILRQLYPVWPGATPGAVQWNIDYLALKLRLAPDPDVARSFGRGHGERLNGTKDMLTARALRLGLVRVEDLELLRSPSAAGAGHAGR